MLPTSVTLPSWFYLGRAIVSLIVGLAVIWHEATSDVQVIALIAGLLLAGVFAPTDVAAWRAGEHAPAPPPSD